MVERAGGVVVGVQHKTKPRYFRRSLVHRLTDRGAGLATTVLTSPLGAGVLKLGLEIVTPLAEWGKRGEAIRCFVRRRGDAAGR